MTPQDQVSYQPQLNHEHSEAKWWKWSEITGEAAPPLHPVVKQLLKGGARQELAASLPVWTGEELGKKHHPVEKRGSGLPLVYAPLGFGALVIASLPAVSQRLHMHQHRRIHIPPLCCSIMRLQSS